MKVSFSPLGGASTQVGPATVSANPITQSVGVNVPTFSSGDVSGRVGVGVGAGGVGVTPTFQIGDSSGARTGGSVGGTAGSAVGSIFGGPIGSAAGSAVGSALGSGLGDLFGGNSTAQREHDQRDSYRGMLGQLGIIPANGKLPLPDGSVADFSADSQSGKHKWADPTNKLPGVNRDLFAYETDTSNDLDYYSSMAGITLSRLLAGKTSKEVDQLGNQIGNQALGSVGYGKPFTQENFNTVSNNMRSIFQRAHIQSQSELNGLINKAVSEGRLNDSEHAVAQQIGTMMFNNDFNTAQKLVGGRQKGLATAQQTPAQEAPAYGSDRRNKPGRIYSPIISPEEAILSVQPFIDYHNRMQAAAGKPATTTAANVASGIGLVTAGTAAFAAIDRAAGGIFSRGIKGVAGSIGQALGITGGDTLEGVHPDMNYAPTQDGGDIGFEKPDFSQFETSSSDVPGFSLSDSLGGF